MDTESVRSRTQALLALQVTGQGDSPELHELHFGALSILGFLYGQESSQVEHLRASRPGLLQGRAVGAMRDASRGALRAALSDLESGLVGSVHRRVTGEVYSDFLTLAKQALDENTEAGKNVAAVLSAATFEDTIRRMGQTLAGINSRESLGSILSILKERAVMQGAQVGIAQSYLKFRNDALHADWALIDRASVQSVIAFVEALLMKHFSY